MALTYQFSLNSMYVACGCQRQIELPCYRSSLKNGTLK